MRAEGAYNNLNIRKNNRTFNNGWGIIFVLLKIIYPWSHRFKNFFSSTFFKLGPNKVDYRKSASQVDWRYIHLHIFCMSKETKRTFLTPLKRVSYSYNLKCLSLIYDHTLKVSISQIFQKGHFYSVSWKYPPRKLREHSRHLISQASFH